MRKTFVSALSSLLVAVCLGGVAHGQTGPSGPGGSTPTVTPTVTAGPISEQALEAALKALDPNLKVEPTSNGQGKIYRLKIVRDGWNFNVMIASYSNCMWVNAEGLSPVIASPQSLPSSALVELLKANFKVGPWHFSFAPMSDNSGVTLFLTRLIGRPNSAEEMNATLNDLIKTVRDTHPIWSQIK